MKPIVFILFMFLITLSTGHQQELNAQLSAVKIANLGNPDDDQNFQLIRQAFQTSNPGYDLSYLQGVNSIEPGELTQVMFVQEIDGITNQEVKGNIEVIDQAGNSVKSEAIVGDILILEKGERLSTDSEMGLLVFQVPQAPEDELPSIIRPDWDPNITDVPGGCATEIDAYRRILLTWREDVGNYIYHSINAHRVRIRDSFSHYHPVNGGFDEFYLVQMVEPGAKIITSEQTDLIIHPEQVEKDQVQGLIQEYELEIGDLVYLPRGVTHRGYGGVVTQVITVPGFIPGSEIGVDHHLRVINERLGLDDEDALPYNLEASEEEIIK
jgi:hypothetical protein